MLGFWVFEIFCIVEGYIFANAKKVFNMKKKHYVSTVFLIVIYLFVFVLIVRDSVYYAPNPESGVTLDEDIWYDNFEGEGIVLKVISGISLRANKIHQKISFENDQSNRFVINVILRLGNGTVIYESGYIYPSEKLSEINLYQSLEAGIYNDSVLVYDIYSLDDEHRFISRCELPIDITCFG